MTNTMWKWLKKKFKKPDAVKADDLSERMEHFNTLCQAVDKLDWKIAKISEIDLEGFVVGEPDYIRKVMAIHKFENDDFPETIH